jgi:hypothetical protein
MSSAGSGAAWCLCLQDCGLRLAEANAQGDRAAPLDEVPPSSPEAAGRSQPAPAASGVRDGPHDRSEQAPAPAWLRRPVRGGSVVGSGTARLSCDAACQSSSPALDCSWSVRSGQARSGVQGGIIAQTDPRVAARGLEHSKRVQSIRRQLAASTVALKPAVFVASSGRSRGWRAEACLRDRGVAMTRHRQKWVRPNAGDRQVGVSTRQRRAGGSSQTISLMP